MVATSDLPDGTRFEISALVNGPGESMSSWKMFKSKAVGTIARQGACFVSVESRVTLEKAHRVCQICQVLIGSLQSPRDPLGHLDHMPTCRLIVQLVRMFLGREQAEGLIKEVSSSLTITHRLLRGCYNVVVETSREMYVV